MMKWKCTFQYQMLLDPLANIVFAVLPYICKQKLSLTL